MSSMSREALIAAVQFAADDHPRRARRALHREQAERCIEAVVAEVLAIVEPFALNQWGGDVVLKRVRELRGACDGNGARGTNEP